MNLYVSPSPHIRSSVSTQKIMLDVLIALLPACAVGIWAFGLKTGIVLLVSVASAILTEYVLHKMMKRPNAIGDLSAAVTGLLLGMNLPVSAPWWIAVIGSVFAIGIVKVAFGGIGKNFVNPALAARALLLASWPVQMTSWNPTLHASDVVTSATPLALMKTGQGIPQISDLLALNTGGGCIGEISAIALLIGGVYLLMRQVIGWRIPVFFIGTVFLFSLIAHSFDVNYAVVQILSGGLFLGAIFMATDYTTSPVTPTGQIIMAVGCGLITSIIRFWGGYPEGVSYSILLMNLAVPLIERFTRTRTFGEVKRNA